MKNRTENHILPNVFTQHKDKIYRLSYEMTGNKDTAKDITQETFLKFYENIDKFRGESKISTWLYAVAKNSCLQYLKGKKRSKPSELKSLQESVADTSTEHFSNTEKNNYINQVKEGCLLGLLRTLSFYQRIAFILNILHEHSLEDTSKILNKSESATRTLIHRARKNIKEFLCGNCSLYDSQNPCRCERMINFSLKKGWVKYDEKYSFELPAVVSSELGELRKITELYTTLPNHEMPGGLLQKLKQQNFLIFSDKKVK